MCLRWGTATNPSMVPVPYPHTSTILLRGQSGWIATSPGLPRITRARSIQVGPLPVDTVSSVEIAHQLHRGVVEINTFKLATFVKVE